MKVSKKLSIAQLILALTSVVFFIIGFTQIVSSNLSIGSITSGGFALIISIWIIPIAILVIGIIQIVYFSKEKPGGVYLASGIMGIMWIFSFLPFINFAIWITTIILNIIGASKK